VITRSGNLDRTANTAVPAESGRIPDTTRVFTQSLPSGKAAAIHLFTNGPSPAGQIRHTPVNPVAVGYHHRTHAPARIVLPLCQASVRDAHVLPSALEAGRWEPAHRTPRRCVPGRQRIYRDVSGRYLKRVTVSGSSMPLVSAGCGWWHPSAAARGVRPMASLSSGAGQARSPRELVELRVVTVEAGK
jgi:hypothetical protein